MADQPVQSLETHLQNIAQQIEQKKPQLESATESSQKESLVRNEIKQFVEHMSQSSSAPTPTHTQTASQIQAMEPNQKVGSLINLVYQKGIDHAVTVAKKLDDPALLDEFHDTLVDNLYNELIKRGVIKIV